MIIYKAQGICLVDFFTENKRVREFPGGQADMTKLKYLRKVNLEAYGYAIKAEHLMNSQS